MNDYVIETVGLTKQYGMQFGVNDLSLHVPKGKIYGLLGRNGAGKTTTMRMLLNLIRPTSGTIQLFGKDYLENPNKIYRKIGSIIESPGFYENLTGQENLQILARLRGQHRKDSVQQALEIVGLDIENRKVYSHYSMGMKQRLGIAAAIMHEPELLILDEPINGLDPIGIHEIRKFLLSLCKEKGVTVLISSHVLDEIEQIADMIGVMHEGRLIEEVYMDELRRRNRQYVEFEVSDVNNAAVLLERLFDISDYEVCDDKTIRVFERIEHRGEITRQFVQKDILVTKVQISSEKLEDYFSTLIGGGGIG
ncbi:MAG: ABC transporter ATP-binding protein [Anaerocolumna aminovalerica]|jgi:bacitracin transport system ATP-binding protein|uniref:ABC transporter ATP-binding protein n=1 Tax=Anaerocolumna aminovalerica TaxID=1527 RepID=UPI001C0F34A7|nr:ABC transporter ATP-binding protein [Anaerocolumna aminovalerica]MBU5333430.1 ABC transporter ATP-binding protein [Anaerocolumna aminovalerica]MDU6265789.1 ABC transporter ATP-binding protein [Anaerocolumna aminovalerica]